MIETIEKYLEKLSRCLKIGCGVLSVIKCEGDLFLMIYLQKTGTDLLPVRFVSDIMVTSKHLLNAYSDYSARLSNCQINPQFKQI